jgi:phosphatidylglycerophosphate synthase
MQRPVATRQLYTLPNLVTLLRVLALPPFVLLSARAHAPQAVWAQWGAVLLWLGIAGSDLLDGWLARRLRQTSPLGQALDHSCDVLCILTALSAFVAHGLVPWWLPAAIAWSFLLYVLDSWWRTAGRPQRQLLSSRLGHLGGIFYYLTVGGVTLQIGSDDSWFAARFLPLWYLGLALLAAFSGSERLWLLARAGWRRPAPVTDPTRTGGQ